jgi:hypothetical protein
MAREAVGKRRRDILQRLQISAADHAVVLEQWRGTRG